MFSGNSIVLAVAACAGVIPPIAAVLVRYELRIRRLRSLLEVNIQFRGPANSTRVASRPVAKTTDVSPPQQDRSADAPEAVLQPTPNVENPPGQTASPAPTVQIDAANKDAGDVRSDTVIYDDGILSNPLVELVKVKYAADLRMPSLEDGIDDSRGDAIQELRGLVKIASSPKAFFQSRLIMPAALFGLAAAFGFYAFINAVMSDFEHVFSNCTQQDCQIVSSNQGVLVVGSIVFVGAYIAAMRIVIQAVTSFDLTGYTFVRQGAEVVFSIILGMLIFKAFPDPMQTFGKIMLSTDTLAQLAATEKENRGKSEAAYKACIDKTPPPVPASGANDVGEKTDTNRCLVELEALKRQNRPAVPWYWIVLAAVFGLVPTSSSRYLLNKAQDVFRWSKTADERFSQIARITPLDILDGIDFETRYRLEECGLRDVQNLACANPIMLAIESPFNLNEIIDWIGQAQLCHIVGLERYMLLREYNVRTIFDLERAIDSYNSPDTFDIIYGSILLSPTEAMKIAADTTKIKFLIDDQGSVKHVSLEEFTSWAYKKIALSSDPNAGQNGPANAGQSQGQAASMSDAIEHMMCWISDDLHVRRLRRLWNDIEHALGPDSGYLADSARRAEIAGKLKTGNGGKGH